LIYTPHGEKKILINIYVKGLPEVNQYFALTETYVNLVELVQEGLVQGAFEDNLCFYKETPLYMKITVKGGVSRHEE